MTFPETMGLTPNLRIENSLRFEFHKRGQLFIRTHNEALFVVEVASPDRVTLLLSSKHFNHKVRSP
jgi:hypothetical protein